MPATPSQYPFGAIVLAGGRSSRMGCSKAALRFGGSTIIERIVTELSAVFAEVVVVTSPEATPDVSTIERAGARVVEDRDPFQGPVGAIADGLRSLDCGAAFVCSCDLPLIRKEVAAAICAELGEAEFAAPEIDDRIQPLHAAYSRRSLPQFEGAIGRGERKLRRVIATLRGRVIPELRVRQFDPTLRSFTNVNTPEEYRAALAMLPP
jgi:molybdopterin-guanine dinucleotide biosynthesis protein A